MTATPTTTVTHRWETSLLVQEPDLDDILRPQVNLLDQGTGPCTDLPLSAAVTDEDLLTGTLSVAMRQLQERDEARGVLTPPITGVTCRLMVLRGGHEAPVLDTPGSYTAWLFLQTIAPEHKDSGSLAIYDPRAGAAMHAVPGLPWGRQFTVRPRAGTLAVVPGWLTSALMPVEEGQVIAAICATSTH
ncbi:hypothetical protein ACWC5I_10585 [Kitasatospora sp. NPDC001574]